MINGSCQEKYIPLKKTFEGFFLQNQEKGAAFSVYQNGKELINLYGGYKNLKKQNWEDDTIVNVFSATKGIYELLVCKLIEIDKIDIRKPVFYYWDKFKESSKRKITVENILSHESGIFRFKKKINNKDLLDWDKIINLLENQTPEHEPGHRTFYHSITHGFLIGEIIRNIFKKSLGEILDIFIKKKFDLSFYIGVPNNNINKVAKLDSQNLNNLNQNEIKEKIKFYNSKEYQVSEIPSINGHGNAKSLAKIYDIFANDIKLKKNNFIDERTMDYCLEERSKRIDENLKMQIRWTRTGLILRGGWLFGKNKESFGHNGWGGSLGFGDPIKGLGISYVTSYLNPTMGSDNRAISLIKKFYEIENNS